MRYSTFPLRTRFPAINSTLYSSSENSTEENYCNLVTSSSLLPLAEHLVKEAIDGRLEVKVPVHVKVLNLAAHLYEEVDHGGGGPEDHNGALSDDSTGDSVTLTPYFTHITPHGVFTKTDLLFKKYHGLHQGLLQPPHFAPAQVLLLK